MQTYLAVALAITGFISVIATLPQLFQLLRLKHSDQFNIFSWTIWLIYLSLIHISIGLFIDEPSNRDLRNHALHGKWSGYRSISVGGDLRLHFKVISSNRVLFEAVGSHDQLYKS